MLHAMKFCKSVPFGWDPSYLLRLRIATHATLYRLSGESKREKIEREIKRKQNSQVINNIKALALQRNEKKTFNRIVTFNESQKHLIDVY